MKRISIILFIIAATMATAISAQNPGRNQRQKWFEEMKELKHEFLAKQLKLSDQQREKFFDIYDRMDEELERLNAENRELERKIKTTPAAKVTDVDYDQAIQSQLDLKGRECEIEKRYYAELRNVLSKKQLFELKAAEQEFRMQVMRQHRKIKK